MCTIISIVAAERREVVFCLSFNYIISTSHIIYSNLGVLSRIQYILNQCLTFLYSAITIRQRSSLSTICEDIKQLSLRFVTLLTNMHSKTFRYTIICIFTSQSHKDAFQILQIHNNVYFLNLTNMHCKSFRHTITYIIISLAGVGKREAVFCLTCNYVELCCEPILTWQENLKPLVITVVTFLQQPQDRLQTIDTWDLSEAFFGQLLLIFLIPLLFLQTLQFYFQSLVNSQVRIMLF